MKATFRINTIGPPRAIAHFAPPMDRRNRSLMAVIAALHPGTVNSAMSAPLQGAELLPVLDGLHIEHTGASWSYDGQRLPW